MSDSIKLLSIYVNHHLAGAVAGVSLCRRMSEQAQGSPLGDLAAELLLQIEADHGELERSAKFNGIASDPIKRLGALIAERIGRLKLNGYILRRSPLIRAVLEIEMLMAGIDARCSLWQALMAGDRVAPLDLGRLNQLVDRAQSQLLGSIAR